MKVYKLLQLVLLHFQNRIKEIKRKSRGNAASIASFSVETPYKYSAGERGAVLDGGQGINGEEEAEFAHYLGLGQQLVAHEQSSLAKAFEKAIALRPRNVEAYFRLSWVSGRKELLGDVLRLYEKLITEGELIDKTDLHDLRYYFLNSNPEVALMYHEKFEALFLKAMARDQKNSDACIALGGIYQMQGRYAAAEGFYTKAVDLDSRVMNKGLDCLAVLYHDAEKVDLSEKYLRKANKVIARYYSAATIANYHRIKSILDAYRIKLVCVQYPLRNIKI